MKLKLKNWWTLVVAQVLSLLGFQSCDGIGSMRCEYGQPYVHYTLKGTVKDNSGNPVEGIRVSVQRRYNSTDDLAFAKDTLYTDKDGIVGYTRSECSEGITDVYIEDIDGPENGGEFESLTLKDVNTKQTEKGKSWYGGAFEASFDAKLTKK